MELYKMTNEIEKRAKPRGFVSAELYKDFMDSFPKCTVDILIFNDEDKILLFKRTNKPYKGEYFTPGGRLFKNEEPKDCAVRQLVTESGLTISRKDIGFAGILNEINPNSIFPSINYHSVNIVYFLEINRKDLKIKLDSQHSGAKWFDIDDSSIHVLVKEKIKLWRKK